MPEDSEDKIEEIVDRKVEEKLHQKLSGEDTGDDYISQRIEEKLQELSETGEDPGSPIDRRSFLKALGLGAGGLALASPAASFLSLQNTAGGGGGSGTLSEVLSNGNDINSHDIVDGGTTVWDTSAAQVPSGVVQSTGLDADTVDGKEASDLGKSIKQNLSGSPYISQTQSLASDLRVSTTRANSNNSNTNSITTYISNRTGTVRASAVGDMDGTVNEPSVNMKLWVKANGNTFAYAQTSGTRTNTSTTGTGYVGSAESITLKLTVDTPASKLTFFTGRVTAITQTRSKTYRVSATSSMSAPVWVKGKVSGTQFSGGGLSFNGVSYNTNSQLIGSVTTSDNITLSTSWSGVTNTTTANRTAAFYKGSYI